MANKYVYVLTKSGGSDPVVMYHGVVSSSFLSIKSIALDEAQSIVELNPKKLELTCNDTGIKTIIAVDFKLSGDNVVTYVITKTRLIP